MFELMQQLVSDVYTFAGRSCVDVVLTDGNAGKRINQAVNDILTKFVKDRPQLDLRDSRVARQVRADLSSDMMRISDTIRRRK